MASAKTITTEALKKLGPRRLAELLAEACENDAPLRRKVEILLASKEGGDKLKEAIAKRIAALKRARKFVDWREAPTLAAELDALREGIVAELGNDPQSAIEQLWLFLEAAKITIERVDDSGGAIGGAFHQAADELGVLLSRAPDLDGPVIAERLHASLASDSYGVFERIISSGAAGLGSSGRARLRELLKADLGKLPPREDNENWSETGWPRARLSGHLAALADAEGDVDAYIEAVVLGARESIEAASVAERLIGAGRAEEALGWLGKDKRGRGPYDLTIASLRIAALDALGRTEEAQSLRWEAFKKTLSVPLLREHLKRLPDFDDFEAGQRAIAYAASFPDALLALSFLVEWPALEAADTMVREQIAALDGRHYETLGRAAERLSEKWPVSATLLYRALVLSVLERGLSKAINMRRAIWRALPQRPPACPRIAAFPIMPPFLPA